MTSKSDHTTVALIPFTYHGKAVPVQLDAQGEPLWRAADIGRALDYAGDMGQNIRRLDEDERTLISNQGGQQEWWITEAGLYSLILGSRKKEAKAFKRWVTHEVLPEIRKTGQYTPNVPKVRDPAIQMLIDMAVHLDEARAIAEEAKQEASGARQLAQQALDSQQWVTIREYVFLNDLAHQVPESLQADYGRWLTGYCQEKNIPVRNVNVSDRRWNKEHGYHLGTIEKTLPGWLGRRHAQTDLRILPRDE